MVGGKLVLWLWWWMGSLDDDDDGIDDAEVVCVVPVSQLHRGCAELCWVCWTFEVELLLAQIHLSIYNKCT